MRKTPTIFERDFNGNPKYVLRDKNDECSWVFAGEGKATRKYDGTCCMFDGSSWFKRREVKPGKAAPCNFIAVSTDSNTGKTIGWVPVEDSDKWHNEGIKSISNPKPGTYELCGPKVQGNPEGFDTHVMVPHEDAEEFDVDRSFDGLQKWLHSHEYEGLVFHHPDGRMAKIKKRDFMRPD